MRWVGWGRTYLPMQWTMYMHSTCKAFAALRQPPLEVVVNMREAEKTLKYPNRLLTSLARVGFLLCAYVRYVCWYMLVLDPSHACTAHKHKHTNPTHSPTTAYVRSPSRIATPPRCAATSPGASRRAG